MLIVELVKLYIACWFDCLYHWDDVHDRRHPFVLDKIVDAMLWLDFPRRWAVAYTMRSYEHYLSHDSARLIGYEDMMLIEVLSRVRSAVSGISRLNVVWDACDRMLYMLKYRGGLGNPNRFHPFKALALRRAIDFVEKIGIHACNRAWDSKEQKYTGVYWHIGRVANTIETKLVEEYIARCAG